MDYDELWALANLSRELVSHPHLANLRGLVNHELDIANKEAEKALKAIKADEKAKQESAAKADYDRILKDEKAQEAKSPAVRNTYSGVPGPAEAPDTPEPPQPGRTGLGGNERRAIPSSDTPAGYQPDTVFTSDQPIQPTLPTIERR